MVTDKILIWQFNRGRRTALHQIYERYKDDLVTLAAALLTDRGLAEDVVHDVFMGFARSAGKFNLTGSLKGYLSTCVANTARNRNKAEARRRYGPLESTAPAAPRSDDPEFNAMFGEESVRLARALEQLPYEQREVLVLRAYSGMKFTTIAAQQNTSIYTVQGRYRYALEKIKTHLTEGSSSPAQQAANMHLKLRKFSV